MNYRLGIKEAFFVLEFLNGSANKGSMLELEAIFKIIQSMSFTLQWKELRSRELIGFAPSYTAS